MWSVNRLAGLVGLTALGLLAGCAKPPVEPAEPMGDPAAKAEHGAPSDYPFQGTVITKGEEVDVKAHLVSGKTTIVDFSSPFCPPCVALAPQLEALPTKHADYAVIVVDINRPGVEGIDWGSPVAQQYQLSSVPAFQIYGPDGQLVAEGDQATQQVHELL